MTEAKILAAVAKSDEFEQLKVSNSVYVCVCRETLGGSIIHTSTSNAISFPRTSRDSLGCLGLSQDVPGEGD